MPVFPGYTFPPLGGINLRRRSDLPVLRLPDFQKVVTGKAGDWDRVVPTHWSKVVPKPPFPTAPETGCIRSDHRPMCGEFSNGFDLVLSVRRIWPLLTEILEELQELTALETL